MVQQLIDNSAGAHGHQLTIDARQLELFVVGEFTSAGLHLINAMANFMQGGSGGQNLVLEDHTVVDDGALAVDHCVDGVPRNWGKRNHPRVNGVNSVAHACVLQPTDTGSNALRVASQVVQRSLNGLKLYAALVGGADATTGFANNGGLHLSGCLYGSLFFLASNSALHTSCLGGRLHWGSSGLGDWLHTFAHESVVGHVACDEVVDCALHVWNHEQLGAVHLVAVFANHVLERLFVHVDAAKRVARIGSGIVLQGSSTFGCIRLFEPDRVHERDGGIWVIKSKHLAEVVLTSGRSSSTAFGSVHHMDTEQASWGHTVLLEVVVALVQITLGQAKQSFLL